MKHSIFRMSLQFFFLIPLNFISGQEIDKNTLASKKEITIVDRTGIPDEIEHPVAFGKRELYKSIQASGGTIHNVRHWTQTSKGVYIIIGTLENTIVRKLVLKQTGIISNKPEGIFYQWVNTDNGVALVIGGTDSTGLMYGLSEIAERISDKGFEALTEIENTMEFPDNKVRGLDKFIKDENDDSWFFSEHYWQYYIGQLAKNRFNKLTLITGYNDGSTEDFMMPVYPYLLKMDGFEEIKPKNGQLRTPDEYIAQLRQIGTICHGHGLEFVFGIWSHGRSNKLVHGLPENPEKYTTYCSKGIKELLRKVPEIDGIQLRVNYESGVGGFGETAEKFWKEIITGIGDIYRERRGKLFLDLRAKGLTVNIRKWALETGMNINVTSKYTWEGVGLPYHPTEMRKAELAMLNNNDKRQRYGYADFLFHSRSFDYINRLWGIGTLRIFTWADPDYAKRFSHTSGFGGAKGFQITPPLSRKQNTWNLFKNDSLVYYNWEDQRYWAWYKIFGRLGYSEETNPEVWQRTFRKHYGKSYQAVLEAYSLSGKILPLITSSHLTIHPANYNWAEIESGGALFSDHSANPFHNRQGRTYQVAEPGDPGLFYCIEDYVNDILNNQQKPKITPIQLASLYNELAKGVKDALSKVDKNDIPETFRKEYAINEIDLRITASLSEYHDLKTRAATDYVFFEKTQNMGYLKSCLETMKKARAKWKRLVELIDPIYFNEPLFLHGNGTWRDRLVEIEKDIEKLYRLTKNSKDIRPLSHWDNKSDSNKIFNVNFEAIVPESWNTNTDLKVIFKTKKGTKNEQVPKVHFRIANMAAGKFKELNMQWNGMAYEATIPISELNVQYDLLIYFSLISDNGNVEIYPGLFHEKHTAPYYVIKT